MNVLILIENPDDADLAAVDIAVEGHALDTDLRTCHDRASLVSALGHMGDHWDALILTPEPGEGNGALGPHLAELDCFSVEVQGSNIARDGLPSALTDAQVFGMGSAGYRLALDLIAERGQR